MATLQDEQPSFDRAVCDAMVVSTPNDWDVIVLTIERPVDSTAVGELSHSISTPAHNRPAMPDDSLYEATYRLDELSRATRSNVPPRGLSCRVFPGLVAVYR